MTLVTRGNCLEITMRTMIMIMTCGEMYKNDCEEVKKV